MDVAFLAVIATGFGACLWRYARQARHAQSPPIDKRQLDADAEVAVHVALHNARSRQQVMSSLDLLYGLLQDEAIARAVELAGGDPRALEDRVLGALEAVAGDELRTDTGEEAYQVIWIATMIARKGGRVVSCRDLWAYLRNTEAAALLDAERPRLVDVLFAAIHGKPRPLPETGDVHVVIWNDDYTTFELVIAILQDVFALSPEAARTLAMQTHDAGKSTIARMPIALAQRAIADAQMKARSSGSPLHVGFEPA